ncbi:hypothetical protein EDL98_02865 [Ornithobacterium rhinotracheale]|uniref:hypothetical protein n=1 Tax=Ornithobacterium rhinotracheale TaxID=28251 RepID=UPI00129CE173|nr:hypothetical protein [Ornithobacterium rhinotracheale]MRJ08844.1 hypothetical protein [Ornithobacterium rhinotracheale]MRJ10025.1 hypothetical protein [Ornithobacterium rhinotracheale]UOH77725.1 hypothetical protein MT996_11035 [Ornithobacterium rhinotracheale]
MLKKVKYLFVIFVVLINIQCQDDFVAEFHVYNNTDEKIFINIRTSDKSLEVVDFYPSVFILPNSNLPETSSSGDILKNDPIYYDKNEKLYFFVLKESTMEKYGWDEIKKKNIYDAKFSYTFDELKAQDFKIIYNGN